MAQAIDIDRREFIFHKLISEGWPCVMVQRNIKVSFDQDMKEGKIMADWCNEFVGPMYDNYLHDFDGNWFGIATSKEVQTVSGIKFGIAFKHHEDLLMFKLKFGLP